MNYHQIPPPPKVPNQLYRELMGVCGLNPWDGNDSSSRKQMFASHIGQTLVVKGATERFCQTGMEREYGKYTFSTKMPVDAQIIKTIERYRRTLGRDSISENPQTVVLYENEKTKEVGMMTLNRHCSYHQYFGFDYKNKPGISEIRSGAFIRAGTIMQDSPSVSDNGGYRYGVECNIAFMSHPAVSEDGILISRDVLPKFGFKTYEHRVVEFGSKRFPLNLYGDENNFKPFPDIGECIRSDGILMALRTYNENLAVVEQSVQDLMEVDVIFDRLTYAAGAGGRIVDIKVHHDPENCPVTTPVGMDIQAKKYDEARRYFYQEILNEYLRLSHDRGEKNLRLTPELNRLVVEAIAVLNYTRSGKLGKRIHKLYRQAPLDDWRIEFVIEYDVVPTIGFKLTDCHGGKGVVCHVANPEHMPVDQDGNRADIVMDPNSTVARMNLGRLYEQYVNAASRDVIKRLWETLGLQRNDPKAAIHIATIASQGDERFTQAWEYLLGYYQIVSPKMYNWFVSGDYQRTVGEHVAYVMTQNPNGIHMYIPPDNEPEWPEIVKALEASYRPTYGPVTYVGNSGQRVVTKNPVRIGSLYVILLEKIGDDWTALSSGKLQHFGVPSQVTNTDKYAQPTRNQAIRALGEAEVRIYVSYAGPRITAEILDRNSNPAAHREILYKILEADQPTNIQNAVDRTKIPLGGSKPLQLLKHIAETGGWEFQYQPHKPSY